MHERNPDELLLELEVTFHSNGDVELRQGEVEGYDMTVTLHRSQMEWLAREQGYIGPEEVARRQQAAMDRLALLVGLVRSHCPVGHPLRAAADFLMGEEPEDTLPSPAPVSTSSAAPGAIARSAAPSGGLQLELEA